MRSKKQLAALVAFVLVLPMLGSVVAWVIKGALDERRGQFVR